MRTKSGCVFGHLFCGPPKFGVNVLCVYIILYQSFEKPAPGLARRGCFCGVTALRLFRRSCCGARTCLRAGTAPVFARNLVPRRAAPQGLRPCDAGTFKIVSIWPVRVPYRNRLYGFMSICYNFWVLIFRCLSVVLHSVSDCNPCAVDARSVLSRWGGCPGALSGRVPKLFGPFCGPTEGCRAFCGGAHAGSNGTRRGAARLPGFAFPAPGWGR